MWQQRSYFEQSNVLDVTIQCQFNMASKNIAEFSTLYSPSSQTPFGYPQSSPSAFSSCARAQQEPTSLPLLNCVENVTPVKNVSDIDSLQCYAGAMYSNGFNGGFSKLGKQCGDNSSTRNNIHVPEQRQFSSCMNDSGYGSPTLSYHQQPNYPTTSPEMDILRLRESDGTPKASSLRPQEFGYSSSSDNSQCSLRKYDVGSEGLVNFNTYTCSQSSPTNVKSSDELSEDMKTAMRERDVAQRLFTLRARDSKLANELEDYYQTQTSIVDIERHNILCQMAYDNTSSESINQYYNRKLLSVLEFVENKLAKFEKCAKGKTIKRQIASPKKSRLLPKHAVKILESWYQENLENPYPSREVTLSMASEGDISVEQIRKWFANKRNRSRNNKLKVSSAKDGD